MEKEKIHDLFAEMSLFSDGMIIFIKDNVSVSHPNGALRFSVILIISASGYHSECYC